MRMLRVFKKERELNVGSLCYRSCQIGRITLIYNFKRHTVSIGFTELL